MRRLIDEEDTIEIEKKLAELPIGSIAKKNIKGKDYYYHRWYENGKKIEKYVPANELDDLLEKIEYRKYLQNKLKRRRENISYVADNDRPYFLTNVRLGLELKDFLETVKNYKTRECLENINDYLYGDYPDRVLVLCGLRRTGKTTLMKQAILNMNMVDLLKTAFIQINSADNLAKVNQDLKQLERSGYKYVFVDEVTAMSDFIEGAALFSDVYASCGMKIVLSGTDSLGFMITEREQLYDRCIMIHTTFIPYREFENVLGVKGIDKYIEYGGTMSLTGKHYNNGSEFSDKAKMDVYVDSAIAHNIQNSLKNYDYENHFRDLWELYEKDELTSVINRVVEDINHRFTLNVLTKDFISNDLGLSAKNLRRDRKNPTSILDKVDAREFTSRLKKLLDILDSDERNVEIKEVHRIEIREYLDLLDLTSDIDIRKSNNAGKDEIKTVIAQPGLRYAQAKALVNSLLKDKQFKVFPLVERNRVIERILSEIKGRMMEEIILLETKKANPKKEVFVLRFAIGEFDMVIFDPDKESCSIYEIKHSDKDVKEQYKYLENQKYCDETEFHYGKITGKYVIYRGPSKKEGDIEYLNVEEYLKSFK